MSFVNKLQQIMKERANSGSMWHVFANGEISQESQYKMLL